PLDDGAGGEGAAAAHRDERRVLVAALELVQGGGDQAAAGAADGVAEGDGAAVGVHVLPVRLVELTPRHDDGGEGLVDLAQVDVTHGHSGLGQHLGGGVTGT